MLSAAICNIPIQVDDKHQKQPVIDHIGRKCHIKNKELHSKSSKQQPFIGAAFAAADLNVKQSKEFGLDLITALVQSGIPLFKVNVVPFKTFLEKWTKVSVPDESGLRKNYVKPIYDVVIAKIKKEIGDDPVYFILDECTDALNRYLLNILVAPLNGKPMKAMLFKVRRHDFYVDANTPT
ncbi:MAG TPA: hypothetical protein VHT72_06910 [Puia sp.]|nr:hypothetical protein [Puia sp.]